MQRPVQKTCRAENCREFREYGLRGGFPQYCSNHYDPKIHILTNSKECHYPNCLIPRSREPIESPWCCDHRRDHKLPCEYIENVRRFSHNSKDLEEERILMTAPILHPNFAEMTNQELLAYFRDNLNQEMIKIIRESQI